MNVGQDDDEQDTRWARAQVAAFEVSAPVDTPPERIEAANARLFEAILEARRTDRLVGRLQEKIQANSPRSPIEVLQGEIADLRARVAALETGEVGDPERQHRKR